MIKPPIVKANCIVFFGEKLGRFRNLVSACPMMILMLITTAQGDEFLKAALDFLEDVILASEVLRMKPESLAPCMAYLVTRVIDLLKQ